MNATALLYLIRDHPTLLDPAPNDVDGQAFDRRRDDEVHPCFGCGGRARCANIAETSEGPRWLDLCFDCFHEVRKANS